ncbi:Wzz/FepE/Etk N-terminal domain-containing protein [Acidithiobacillus acidisediminis]|uniref:Wzz/FepE/Etk N-terminal domain-containing protein n=1 Tax=Acidithiobacillus acidisediminis TaxID=2937799 RepID=UPI00200C1115|nr:Wzz/FepE/Etk N-terminal domain-containing protein [Acidithiobacillus sp. S30A2]
MENQNPITIQLAYPNPPPPDDEISLRDLWQRLWKRKVSILAITILAVLLALVYLALTPSQYQSSAMVQIGEVGGQPLESGPLLASQLYNQYLPINTVLAKKQLPRLESVVADKDNSRVLTLESRGKTPQQAQEFLDKIVQQLLSTQQKQYGDAVKVQKTQLEEVQKDYRSIRHQIETPSPLGKGADVPLAAISQSQRLSALSGMLAQIGALQEKLSATQTNPTVVTLSARYNPIPVSPKRAVILVLAFIGGLMLGVFVALLRGLPQHS